MSVKKKKKTHKAPCSDSDRRRSGLTWPVWAIRAPWLDASRSFTLLLLPSLFSSKAAVDTPVLPQAKGVLKGQINIDGSPLRVKNHWHTGQIGPAWYYADSRARGIYPEGRGWLGGAAVLAFVHAPFHQLAGQERQTEESNSIPAPVPTAPPSAQRSWTDQPECGEQCYLNSSSSSYAVLDGATLKVSGVIFIYIVYNSFLLPQAISWMIHCGPAELCH